jgi:hypothetical protein
VCLWRRVEDEMARNIGNPQPLSVRIMINAESGAPGCGVRSDKWVLVANHTQTLDVLATMCRGLGLGMLRIDGSTPASQRQGLVRPLTVSVFCVCFLFRNRNRKQKLQELFLFLFLFSVFCFYFLFLVLPLCVALCGVTAAQTQGCAVRPFLLSALIMIKTEAVTDIPLRFSSFHLRFLSTHKPC